MRASKHVVMDEKKFPEIADTNLTSSMTDEDLKYTQFFDFHIHANTNEKDNDWVMQKGTEIVNEHAQITNENVDQERGPINSNDESDTSR